jgi:hypothetical protein
MNSLPGNNNLSSKLAADQRLLAKDTAKGQVNTASTLGVSTNKTQNELKVDVPKEKVTLSTPATIQEKAQPETKDYSNLGTQEQAKATETSAQQASSRSGEALMGFTDTLFGLQENNKQELEDIITQSAMVDTGQLPAENGREVALASTALRTAVAKLQAKMPGATKEQIREAAKTDPEVAKWAAIADSAQNYLSEVQTDNAASAPEAGAKAAEGASAAAGSPMNAPAKNPEMMQNPFKLNPEQQAQMFADNVKTMQAIQNIYQQMWAEIAKARAQRHQLMMETANSINSMIMESHVNRMKSSEHHRRAIMAVILEQKG